MSSECSCILPTGQKCRAIALRGADRCFHHVDPVRRSPARPPRNRFSRISRWRQLGFRLQTVSLAQIPPTVAAILGSLIADGPHGISDREAGRLLRALLRRYGSIPSLSDDEAFNDIHSAPAQPAPAPPQAPGHNPIDPRVLDIMESQLQNPELIRRIRATYSA
jgi:hypothetical protein